MKLIFEKDAQQEISVKLKKDGKDEEEDFNYIEMIRQLIENKNFEESEFKNLSKDEEDKITSMLNEISKVFSEPEN